jgi:hypothetical protein
VLLARRPWIVSFVLFFLLDSAWVVASPIFSGPDEAAQAVKAAAVVRGQLVGRAGPDGHRWLVSVPGPFSTSSVVAFSLCYFSRTDESGSCGLSFTGPRTTQVVSTQFGAYPPLYYAVVGLPSLAGVSATSVYVMRLVSAALTSAFLASAVVSALAWRRSRLLVLGLVAAATPIVIYVGATINDSGLEISAAICLWVSALVLLIDPPPNGVARLLTKTVVAGSALVLARPLSPLWLVVVGATALALGGTKHLRAHLARPSRWAWVALLVICSGLALGWTATVGVDVLGKPLGGQASAAHVAAYMLSHTPTYLRQAVGMFSFDNVPASLFTFVVWAGVVTLLVAAAVALGRRRQVIVLLSLAGSAILIPLAIELVEARRYGLLWQGRYSVPLAAGVPVVAALIVGREASCPNRFTRPAVMAIVAISLAQVGGFVWALHRFVVGDQGPWITLHALWEPPVPAGLLLAAFLLIAFAWTWWMCWLSTTSKVLPPDTARRSEVERESHGLASRERFTAGRSDTHRAGRCTSGLSSTDPPTSRAQSPED